VSQSDQSRAPGKLSHQGPPVLRCAAFEAAQCAWRERSPDHHYYLETKARLGGKQAALTIARKLIAAPTTPCASSATRHCSRCLRLDHQAMTFVRDQSPHQPISRGRLPHCSRRHELLVAGLHRPSGRTAPGGTTPSTIMSPGPPGPSTQIRPGASAHDRPSHPDAATPHPQPTNLNREAALDEPAPRQIRSSRSRLQVLDGRAQSWTTSISAAKPLLARRLHTRAGAANRRFRT
jgi:hypothetical protein